MIFWIYRDKSFEWRWTLTAANNRKIADSGESYLNKADCLAAIGLVMDTTRATPVREKS
jgi:uncharacterized protein